MADDSQEAALDELDTASVESARLSPLSDHEQDAVYCADDGEQEQCALAMHATDNPCS